MVCPLGETDPELYSFVHFHHLLPEDACTHDAARNIAVFAN